jgi:hypothetical protein
MTTITYSVEKYGADGLTGPYDNYVIATDLKSVGEARDVVRRVLGVSRLSAKRRWPGNENTIEAYHDLPESDPNSYGCGGVVITPDTARP